MMVSRNSGNMPEPLARGGGSEPVQIRVISELENSRPSLRGIQTGSAIFIQPRSETRNSEGRNSGRNSAIDNSITIEMGDENYLSDFAHLFDEMEEKVDKNKMDMERNFNYTKSVQEGCQLAFRAIFTSIKPGRFSEVDRIINSTEQGAHGWLKDIVSDVKEFKEATIEMAPTQNTYFTDTAEAWGSVTNNAGAARRENQNIDNGARGAARNRHEGSGAYHNIGNGAISAPERRPNIATGHNAGAEYSGVSTNNRFDALAIGTGAVPKTDRRSDRATAVDQDDVPRYGNLHDLIERKATAVIDERMENIQRRKNLIFSNIPENSEEGDRAKVEEVLRVISCGSLVSELVSTARLGAATVGKNRIIKVLFRNERAVEMILDEKQELMFNHFLHYVYINRDLCKEDRQREYQERLRRKRSVAESAANSGGGRREWGRKAGGANKRSGDIEIHRK